MEKSKHLQLDPQPKSAHERIMAWSVQILAPIVFYFGSKETPWGMSAADLLEFPERTLGSALGKFYKQKRLDPIPKAEYHDAFHVLFEYSTSLKDEVALQFFLWGNGKTSVASIGTSIGAWCIFPRQWTYFKNSYKRGQQCVDVSKLDLKKLLHEDLETLKNTLFN